MSENCRKIYPIDDLPLVIPIGIQSEAGVEEIRFDVKPWLDAWDGLELSVYPTRPGENAAYPAEDVELVGSVLYWRPNDADTAIPGEGTVEVVGITADKRKLSGACKTVCKATSLAVTQEPPEGIKPYYDGIINAASDVKKAAEDVKSAVDAGESGIYLVSVKNEVSDRTQADILAAVEAGKTCLLVWDGQVFNYRGTLNHNPFFVTVYTPEFSVPDGTWQGLWEERVTVLPDGTVQRTTFTPAKTPNPNALTFTGAVEATYDGSAPVSVEIPDVLIVTCGSGFVSSHTNAQVTAAIQTGKTVFLVRDGSAYNYCGMKNGLAKFERYEYVRTGEPGAENGVGIQYWRGVLNADGKFTFTGHVDTATPNPYPLRIKQGDTVTAYNGSENVTVEIPQGGGIADPGKAHQQLVSDADGKAVWTDLLAYKTTEKVVVLPETELTPVNVTPGVGGTYYLLSPLANVPIVGGMCSLTWGGTEYISKAVDVSASVGMNGIGLGNLKLNFGDTLPDGLENPDPNAPYVLLLSPAGISENGVTVYGALLSTGIAPEPPVLSIIGTSESIKKIPSEYLPDSAGKQIILTIDADGNVTTDTPFAEAWAMTDAQLAASIVIKETDSYVGGEVALSGSAHVTRMQSDSGWQMLQVSFVKWHDWTDLVGQTEITRYINWYAGEITLDRAQVYSLPELTSAIPVVQDVVYYARCINGRWSYADIAQLKADLGLT